MTIYNFTYDPRTDPKVLFAQGFQNMVSGLLRRCVMLMQTLCLSPVNYPCELSLNDALKVME